MKFLSTECVLRASELCETVSDSLAKASLGEDTAEARRRLLRMSDHALAASRALDKIAKIKNRPTAPALAEPPEPPAQSVQSEPKAGEMMQL